MREVYKQCLESGVDINYRDISLCDLSNYRSGVVRSRKYQVHSDRLEFTQLYSDLDKALDKFLELKNAKNRTGRKR